MAHRVSTHVVFDTNAVWTGTAHNFLPQPVSNLIKTSRSNAALDIHWYVPQVVRLEREYQMLDQARELLPHLRRAERLLKTSFDVTSDILRTRVQQVIAKSIEEHAIDVRDFDASAVDLKNIVERAALRLPPFEPGDTEKGFRDAIVMETFCQLHKALNLSAPSQLALITNDRLLTQAIHERLGSSPTVAIYANIEELETSLVAFSEKLDQKEAQEWVSMARALLDENLTVKRLRDILFERYDTQLRASPDGNNIGTWHIMLGDTALSEKQNSKLMFVTTAFVYSQVSRPVHSLPFVQMTDMGAKSALTTISKSTAAVPQSTTMSVSSDTLGAGAVFGTFSSIMPSSSIGIPGATTVSTGISVLRNIGRHTFNIIWSAKLLDHQLNEFELIDVKYEGVVWE